MIRQKSPLRSVIEICFVPCLNSYTFLILQSTDAMKCVEICLSHDSRNSLCAELERLVQGQLELVENLKAEVKSKYEGIEEMDPIFGEGMLEL